LIVECIVLFRTVIFGGIIVLIGKNSLPGELVSNAAEIGRIARVHRKKRGLTLQTVSGVANLSPRFLSEFERGKETAEIGKVMKALQTIGLELMIVPRSGSVSAAKVRMESVKIDD
jgi:hypothetical protein